MQPQLQYETLRYTAEHSATHTCQCNGVLYNTLGSRTMLSVLPKAWVLVQFVVAAYDKGRERCRAAQPSFRAAASAEGMGALPRHAAFRSTSMLEGLMRILFR
eukprot:9074661-Pyramimonas_sp.AAC.1